MAGEQAGWLKQAEQASEFFSLRRKVDTKSIERLSERIAADKRRQDKENKEAQARREKANLETIDRWLAGESVQFPYSVDRVFLRSVFTEKHDRYVMETSRGVTVPLSEAKRAFKFAQKMREAGWRRNGETFKVGDFQLDSVTSEGVIAGCHRIGWEEMERFAKLQNWI